MHLKLQYIKDNINHLYHLIRRDMYSSFMSKLPVFFSFPIKEYDVKRPESIINGSV